LDFFFTGFLGVLVGMHRLNTVNTVRQR